MSKKKAMHSHPILRNAGLPQKRVPRRLIVKIDDEADDEVNDRTEHKSIRKKRVSCCG